jgi:hypothetical protein
MVVEEAGNLLPKPTILFFYFKEGEGDRDNVHGSIFTFAASQAGRGHS